MAIVYEPNSITAKFNTLVKASDNLQAIDNLVQDGTDGQNELPGVPCSHVLPDLQVASDAKNIDAVSRLDDSMDKSSTHVVLATPLAKTLVKPRDTEESFLLESSGDSPGNMLLESSGEQTVTDAASNSEQKTRVVENINLDDEMVEKKNEPLGTGPDLDNVDLDAFIRCPEALVLIFFTIAFFMWQAYVAIVDEVAPEGRLTGSKLAQRLGVHRSTISRRKEKPGFEEWAQSIDPDGLAWSYEDGFFVPCVSE